MHRVARATARPGYKLEVEFEDGLRGTIELSARLFGPLFEPLRDEEAFARVGIDEFGVVCWPNGADLAPDAMYRVIQNQHAGAIGGGQG
jgi:hypothetical protein